jgi:hypothetical protein
VHVNLRVCCSYDLHLHLRNAVIDLLKCVIYILCCQEKFLRQKSGKYMQTVKFVKVCFLKRFDYFVWMSIY